MKPAFKIANSFTGMPVSAKTKNHEIGQATSNILNNISNRKLLSMTDQHCNGFRFKVMRFHFKQIFLNE